MGDNMLTGLVLAIILFAVGFMIFYKGGHHK